MNTLNSYHTTNILSMIICFKKIIALYGDDKVCSTNFLPLPNQTWFLFVRRGMVISAIPALKKSDEEMRI